jgi:hypothetical protein
VDSLLHHQRGGSTRCLDRPVRGVILAMVTVTVPEACTVQPVDPGALSIRVRAFRLLGQDGDPGRMLFPRSLQRSARGHATERSSTPRSLDVPLPRRDRRTLLPGVVL